MTRASGAPAPLPAFLIEPVVRAVAGVSFVSVDNNDNDLGAKVTFKFDTENLGGGWAWEGRSGRRAGRRRAGCRHRPRAKSLEGHHRDRES